MGNQSAEWLQRARVLRRMGFGATGTEVDATVGTAIPDLVATRLDSTPEPSTAPAAAYLAAPGKTASTAERKAYQQKLSAQQTELSRWWLQRMVTAREPVHERLALTWHNHFATSAVKVRQAQSMARQNAALRAGSLGDFRALALTMLTDPAMLYWLDAQQNTKKGANENLAREFMELFALGHGNGYTEDDVKQGARALTGWTLDNTGAAKFVPARHDAGEKTVLGMKGPLDVTGFCDAVLAHPKSPSYIATRLWHGLASDTPPSDAALPRLTTAYGARRDLKALTTAIWTDPEFLGGRASVVSGPVEWLVGALRALRITPADTGKKGSPATVDGALALLTTLGQRPFFPPDVGGWPSGLGWASTAAVSARLSAATALTAAGNIATVEQAARTDRIDAAGHLLGVGAWSDVSAGALRPFAGEPKRLVAVALLTPEYLTS
ncbi:DUF1800 domain-containing protein [Tsukamurella sp. NPDC003166]|uniref:DUF1800 domain-containing protein n=1 Tax=Tsukamurella sp. NPDC003166 TaxID=3154444 RepID=UPI0033B7BAC7